MGRAIAARALAGGHEADFIGTHISKAQALVDELAGEGPVGAVEHLDAEVAVLAVPYTEAPHVVRQYARQLGGTVIVDPTNPVDFSTVERPRSGMDRAVRFGRPADRGGSPGRRRAREGAQHPLR